jgi:hypothetical protein
MLERHMSNFQSSFSSVSGGENRQLVNNESYLSQYQLNSLRNSQRAMKIDSIYRGPSQSYYLKSVHGSIQRDKRLKMNNTLMDVNSRLDSFQNLRSGRTRKTPGKNTSRSKLSNSNARLNMRKFKPVTESPREIMADEIFSNENDEYFTTGIYYKNKRNNYI